MEIGVLVNGARGKMGQEVVKAVSGEKDMKIVGQADIEGNLSEVLAAARPDVMVDFTHPSCRMENVLKAMELKIDVVVGTTGYEEEELKEIHRKAEEEEVGVLIAPNFCIGAVLMMRFATEAAKFMPSAEIVELHHPGKADAPSGTARLTAGEIAKSRGEVEKIRILDPEMQVFRGGVVSGVPIHSVRLPGLVAHQEVIFGGNGQVLTIRHDSLNRESFMPGVLMGIRSVLKWKGLVYGLDRVLFRGEEELRTGL